MLHEVNLKLTYIYIYISIFTGGTGTQLITTKVLGWREENI